MFLLQVTRGPDKGKKLPLETGKTYSVGSNEEASLRLSDPTVLKDHCTLEVGEDSVILRNNTASAGTYVGDKKIAQARLGRNTLFRVGDTLLALTAAKVAAPRPAPAPDALIGKILGGYKLNEVVGEGGMGKVYKATQLSLHRDVALKVLRDQLAKDKSFRDLFVNEARAAAQLIHPNVVQVYDAGSEGDVVFFSMEYIGQGSVEEILAREGKIPWEKAILMVLEAAHGLQYAESKGIVHRDIKPDNLMINDDGRVKIADLGLAKRGEGSKDQGIIGTPHFIPPEQALGQEVDSRADIYSLGATFFRMITGRSLFSGKTAKEIVLKHIKEPPPAVSSVERGAPDDLELVLATMLAKDPGQRYQNAGELIKALEHVCAHHGIKGSIIKRGVGKRVLIPLVLLLVGAGGVIWWFAGREPEKYDNPELIAKEQAAQEERRRALEQARKAEQEKRRAKADAEFKDLETGFFKLQSEQPLKSVFDDVSTAPQQKATWETRAGEFETFAEQEHVLEFEDELHLAQKARERGKFIRETLRKFEESAVDKREKTEAKITGAKEIGKRLQGELSELRAKRHYEAAANLCAVVDTGKPAKADPFREIVEWEWVSPVDRSISQKATETPRIMKVVEESRTYFRNERPRILDEAQKVWQALEERNKALSDDAPDADFTQLIQELQKVRDAFQDREGDAVPEIRDIVGKALQTQNQREKQLEGRRAARLAEDRLQVRNTQRRLCSLDGEQLPNSVMDADFAAAIAAWSNLLLQGNVKTELYQEFVKERIEMLRWCEYLFARFHVDIRREVKLNEKIFRSLDIETIPTDKGDLSRVKLTDKTDSRTKFAVTKPLRGDSDFRFGQFPLDWVYYTVFLNESEPRWQEVPPVLEFALGAFCFETMQYKEAQRHFRKVLDAPDPEVRARYGAWAQALHDRAEKEKLARAEWEAICQAVGTAETSQQVADLKTRALAFAQVHEGTIFFLETMGRDDTVRLDFYPADRPETDLPAAPPPPTE